VAYTREFGYMDFHYMALFLLSFAKDFKQILSGSYL